MRAPLALPLLLLALAGCTAEAPVMQGPADPLAAAEDGARDGTGNVSFEAPAAWHVGKWWLYRTAGGPEPRAVTADQGGAWMVSTASETTAFFEAQSDISTIGPIRKGDLAGSQGGTPVEYFRWPLAANATWTTTWDGVPRTVRVLGPSVANIGGQSYPAMALEASEGARVAVRYDYVPAAGWFSRAEFLDADGTTFGLTLQNFGTRYNGTIVEARLHELYRDAAQGPLKPAGSFEVPPGLTFVDARGLFRGDSVHYRFDFAGPDGVEGSAQVGPCTANCTLPFEATLPPAAGTWAFTAAGLVLGTQVQPEASLAITGVEFLRREFG